MASEFAEIEMKNNDDVNITPLITVRGAARILSVHVNTVRRWDALGVLKSYRINKRGDRRFKREDIIQFVNGGRT